jgi:hypothetical protein
MFGSSSTSWPILNLCTIRFSFRHVGLGGAIGGILFIFVGMQEAGNLSPQYGRLLDVSERARRIEKLALELSWNCVPLHDDGRSEAAKNMLLDVCDSTSVEAFSCGFVLCLEVSRTDYFVEIVCQPGLVLREFGEASLRTPQFTDFARNIGVFKCFGAFRRFFSKLFGREHETLLCDTEGGLPLNGAMTPAYWVLLTIYGDDQDELRRRFARFQRLARLSLRCFPRKGPAREPYSKKPPPTPVGTAIHLHMYSKRALRKVAQTG